MKQRYRQLSWKKGEIVRKGDFGPGGEEGTPIGYKVKKNDEFPVYRCIAAPRRPSKSLAHRAHGKKFPWASKSRPTP